MRHAADPNVRAESMLRYARGMQNSVGDNCWVLTSYYRGEWYGYPFYGQNQRRLAEEVTTFVHSPEALKEAQNITEALYHGSIADLTEHELTQAFGKMPTVDVSNEEKDVVNWLVDSTIYKSKRQAREDITNGAVTINGVKVQALNEIVLPHKNSNGKYVIVRKGKKNYTLARIQK